MCHKVYGNNILRVIFVLTEKIKGPEKVGGEGEAVFDGDSATAHGLIEGGLLSI